MKKNKKYFLKLILFFFRNSVLSSPIIKDKPLNIMPLLNCEKLDIKHSIKPRYIGSILFFNLFEYSKKIMKAKKEVNPKFKNQLNK